MLYDDPEEMRLLTDHWSAYLSDLKLKLLIKTNKEVISFLTNMEFISFEENIEQVQANSISFFPVEVNLPEYKLLVNSAGNVYELCKYPFMTLWFIGQEQLDKFFAINKNQALFITEIIDKFDVLIVLYRIRNEARLRSYKEKYLSQPLKVQDVVFDQEGNIILLLEDGAKAKLINTLPPSG